MEKIKILFFAFGYSIHAERRAKVFSTDNKFEVHIISDYEYDIENVKTTVLNGKKSIVQAKKHLKIFIIWLHKFLKKNQVQCHSDTLFREMLTNLFAYRQILKVVRHFKPDIIFQQTLLYPSYLGCLLSQKIPKIITFWNGDLIWWSQTSEILKVFKRQIIEFGIRNASAVTVNSETAKKAALASGIAPQKLHVIRYPGVDVTHFNPGNSVEARRLLGLEGRRVVLCPRGLGGYLNSDVLIQAACAVCKIFPDVFFVFTSKVGTHLWDDLMKLPRRMKIDHHFRHDGQIPWEHMPEYYRSADIMVSPSSNDSQPNCMLEAMSCGTAVVMGDIPSIREWIIHDRNGLLTPPRDPAILATAIITLLQDEAKRKMFQKINMKIINERVVSEVVCKEIKKVVIDVIYQKKIR